MDDRTVLATSAEGLIKRVENWHEWSKGVELIENETKQQYMGRASSNKQKLRDTLGREGLEEWTKICCAKY